MGEEASKNSYNGNKIGKILRKRNELIILSNSGKTKKKSEKKGK